MKINDKVRGKYIPISNGVVVSIAGNRCVVRWPSRERTGETTETKHHASELEVM